VASHVHRHACEKGVKKKEDSCNFFFVGGDVAAKYTREGEGLAEEGWVINFRVVSTICNGEVQLTAESSVDS